MSNCRSLPSAFSIGRPDRRITFLRIYEHTTNVRVVQMDKSRHPGEKRRLLRFERDCSATPWPHVEVLKALTRACLDVPQLKVRIDPASAGSYAISMTLAGQGVDVPVRAPGVATSLVFSRGIPANLYSWISAQCAEAQRMLSCDSPASSADLVKVITRFAG